MDLAATLFSTGWASGVNAYGTVALLGILGRLNVGEVPAGLESTPVIGIALALFLVEFVVDKVPWLDSAWDSVHTVIRPLIAIVLGFQFGGAEGVAGIEEAFGAGMSGVVALASHAVKAGIRLGINTSPEPASNILASLTEDGLVAIVVLFAVDHPYLAAAIAAILLAIGVALIAFLWSRVRAALRRRRHRKAGLPPEEEPPERGRLTRWPVAFAVLALAGAVIAALLVARDEGWAGDPRGAEVEQFEIDSAAVDRSQPVSLIVPDGGGEGRPLLVLLHGRGGDENSMLGDPIFAALDELGDRAPVVVAPDGGNYSYWHDRDIGDWGGYVVDEVIPEAIERSGADPDRVAIGGVSMGGFGAFDLARLNPGEFCAVGGHSPAIWATAEETAPGAFDDAEDFANHDLVSAAESDPAGLEGPELWIDAGDADPFLPGIEAFVAALESSGLDIEVNAWPGGHDGGYWDQHWDEYLRFYGAALDAC